MERNLMKKCTPAVERHWLLIIGGLLWSVVGIALCMAAGFWLSNLEWPMGGLGAAAGLAAGAIIYRYGFSRIAAQNIRRLSRKPDTLCMFAFQAWRSYILIGVMVVLGYALRHSNLPRLILAFIYLSIGTGLTLSSSLYYEQIAHAPWGSPGTERPPAFQAESQKEGTWSDVREPHSRDSSPSSHSSQHQMNGSP